MSNEAQKAWNRICVRHGLKESHRLSDIGWVCSECRKDYPPEPHHLKTLALVEELASKMTRAQTIMLKSLSEYQSRYAKAYKPQDYNFGSKTKVLKNLTKIGFAEENPYGGYEITEAGRYVLSKSNADKSDGKR